MRPAPTAVCHSRSSSRTSPALRRRPPPGGPAWPSAAISRSAMIAAASASRSRPRPVSCLSAPTQRASRSASRSSGAASTAAASSCGGAIRTAGSTGPAPPAAGVRGARMSDALRPTQAPYGLGAGYVSHRAAAAACGTARNRRIARCRERAGAAGARRHVMVPPGPPTGIRSAPTGRPARAAVRDPYGPTVRPVRQRGRARAACPPAAVPARARGTARRPPSVAAAVPADARAPTRHRPEDFGAIREPHAAQQLVHGLGAAGDRRHPDRGREAELGSFRQLTLCVA